MNILFIGTTGIHHTLIAAHFYMGRLSEKDDYSELQLWGDRASESLGVPLFLDYDHMGNKVYVLGVGWDVQMAQKSIEQLDKLLSDDRPGLIVEPVFIKREKLLLFLHRLGRMKKLNQLVQMLIAHLLTREINTIQKQVNRFKEGVTFV